MRCIDQGNLCAIKEDACMDGGLAQLVERSLSITGAECERSRVRLMQSPFSFLFPSQTSILRPARLTWTAPACHHQYFGAKTTRAMDICGIIDAGASVSHSGERQGISVYVCVCGVERLSVWSSGSSFFFYFSNFLSCSLMGIVVFVGNCASATGCHCIYP